MKSAYPEKQGSGSKVKKLVAAFATDGEGFLFGEHFGNADFFTIYDISPSESRPVLNMVNPTIIDDEERHADPEKAKGVGGTLKKHQVQAVISQTFGPNIQRIRKQFVCIMVDVKTIEEGIRAVQNNFNIIIKQWEIGVTREPLNLKGKNP